MDLEEKKQRARELLEKAKEERALQEKKMWENLKPLNEEGGFVPPLPIPMTKYHENKLVLAGAIPKKDLVDQKWYIGQHRQAKIAKWEAIDNIFKYRRNKFGSYYWDDCNHFEDDDGYALFVPTREATVIEVNAALNDK